MTAASVGRAHSADRLPAPDAILRALAHPQRRRMLRMVGDVEHLGDG